MSPARLRDVFSGTMQVNTVSGDVVLYLVEGSNARVSLSTASGELRCEHDAHEVTATETLWTGQIGTGAGTLNVQTISGDTHIQRGVGRISEDRKQKTEARRRRSRLLLLFPPLV